VFVAGFLAMLIVVVIVVIQRRGNHDAAPVPDDPNVIDGEVNHANP
jgi:hypothetical protein